MPRMYLTATGRYVATQDEARKEGKGWHLELVPDVKADLIDYLNDKLAAPRPAPAEPEPARLEMESPAMPQLVEQPPADDGLPQFRSGFTRAQVDAMFRPYPPELRELSYQIEHLTAAQLAHVAFEVAARFARLGQ